MKAWIFVKYALVAVGIYVFLRFFHIFRRLGMYRWAAVIVSGAAVGLMLWQRMFWGVFFYTALILLLGDTIGFILRSRRWEKFWRGGITGIVAALAISIYGYFNAQNIRTTHYDVHIEKNAGGLEHLRTVFVSDLHLGSMFGKKKMEALAARINELEPDIVLLGGDIYDNTPPELINKSLEIWKAIKAPRGIYYIGGNHEYGSHGGNSTAVFPRLAEAGVYVLEDKSMLVDKAFYIIGRRDLRVPERMDIAELMQGVDITYPIILLDHQPAKLDEASKAGADLLMSGHTHGGQIWPFGWAAMFAAPNKVLYGPAQRGDMQVIVSSGAGTWGFPMRIGTKSEIVAIDIKFGRIK